MSTASSLRARRRTLAVITSTLGLAASLLVAGAGAAQADPVVLQPGELVVNGGAEQPVSVGWTGALSRATHGSGGYPASIIVGPAGNTGTTFPGGAALFTGTGANSVATQTIDLNPSAAAIDNGQVNALLSAYVGGYSNQNDNARVTYNFLNAGGTSLATVTFGPVSAADRGSVGGFVPFTATQALPVGTRQAVVTITAQRFVAPANDGYVDNISLVLDAPSPTAVLDQATTPQDVPVIVTPRSNDTAGTGAALVPSSVRLLDGATETTTLTNADGTYQVNTSSGDVIFTPTPGFVGITTPVPYRITDTSGQRAQSTIEITVTFVAAPALALVKSASPSSPADFTVGTTVTYSFVVTNVGNVTMNNIAIDEISFSGENPMSAVTCPLASLAPTEQETCTASYTLTQTDIDSGFVSNTAAATGIAAGSVSPTVSPQSSFGVPLAAAPALRLDKSVAPTTANRAGDVVTYSFLVTNSGNVTVNTVTINEVSFSGTNDLSAISCPTAALLPGQNLTCTASYELSQADVDSGTIANTATATAITPSLGSVSSGSSTAGLPLLPQPSLTFVKTADRSTVVPGQVVTYSFTVRNTGNVTLSQLAVKETDFSGKGTMGEITCPAATIAPASSVSCTAKYTLLADDLASATLVNTAAASATTPATGTLASDPSTVTLTITTLPASTPGTTGDALPATGSDLSPLARAGIALTLLGAAILLARSWRVARRTTA